MIDWENDDGVNLPMICDYLRNQFYEDIITNNVQGKTVLDIGFGTGLLSILALKHGAKKIIAYENDKDRFELGLEVIESCGLKEKINLINERYNWTLQDSIDPDIVLTETVGRNIWEEGMWGNLPRKSGPLFLPGEYFCEIYTKSVPKVFAECLGTDFEAENYFFNPGINIDKKFIEVVNSKISNWRKQISLPQDIMPQGNKITKGINTFSADVHTVWGWQPWLKSILQESYLNTKIVIDANKRLLNGDEIDHNMNNISTEIEIAPDDYTLIVPRTGLQYGDHKFYLDSACWGPTRDGIISTGLSKIKMTYSTQTGEIQYVAVR